MRSWLKRQIYKRLTSLPRREASRASLSARRQARGEQRELLYFHRFGDPASAITAPLLLRLADRFDVSVTCHIVGPPDPAVVPEPEQLDAFARADADRLARRMGLAFRDPGTAPAAGRIDLAERAALDGPGSLTAICAVDAALWSGETIPAPERTGAMDDARDAGSRLRDRLGHFQSGTVWFENEWYWSADRLHYLETRLRADGAARPGSPDTPLAPVLHETGQGGDAGGARIVFFPSLRSPYTYLAAERTFALARRWNAEVEIRFVLPMVMRSLPVPRRKGVYFLKDCAREADRLGLPFGDICDPLGRPTERGLAVLHHANETGRGEAFLLSMLKGVWADGLDAGSDRGLRRIAERAGLDWAEARAALEDGSWRTLAEHNRTRLAGLGLWGVPSFQLGDCAVWGQDRLWVVEDALRALAER